MSETRPIRVLLVDDDEDDQLLTREALTDAAPGRYELECVATYEAGLAAVACGEHDVYLLDYRLGERDGLALLREGIARGCQAPIILLTGVGDREVDAAALRAGAADYLVKGQITPDLLDRSIRYALERQQAQARALELTREQVARTAAEQLAEVLRVEQERLALAQAAGRIGTFEWDLTTGGLYWSSELEALYGLAPGEFDGRWESWAERLHAEDRERAQQEVRRAAAEGIDVDTQFRVVRPDGTLRYLAARARTFRGGDGRPRRLLGVNVDVTDREQALMQAREALRVRDEVLSAVSHDLKNPLTAILGQAQLLSRQLRDLDRAESNRERFREGLARIASAASRMSTWIDELLDVARLELGQHLQLRLEPTDVLALVQQSVAEHQQTTAQHHICVMASVHSLVGWCDAPRLRRVLDNLLANAIKYTPGGGEITVTIGKEQHSAGEWAVLQVCDPGVGIPAADQPHIFERFHRARNVAGRIAGTGIGLAGACQIVAQHGGSIEVDSLENQGSTFTVRLPLRPPAEQADRAA